MATRSCQAAGRQVHRRGRDAALPLAHPSSACRRNHPCARSHPCQTPPPNAIRRYHRPSGASRRATAPESAEDFLATNSLRAWQTPDVAPRHHSVAAMKPTTLLSCSVLTMRAKSALASLVGATRTRYSPPVDGPLAMLSLLVSKKLATSAAVACGWKRIST